MLMNVSIFIREIDVNHVYRAGVFFVICMFTQIIYWDANVFFFLRWPTGATESQTAKHATNSKMHCKHMNDPKHTHNQTITICNKKSCKIKILQSQKEKRTITKTNAKKKLLQIPKPSKQLWRRTAANHEDTESSGTRPCKDLSWAATGQKWLLSPAQCAPSTSSYNLFHLKEKHFQLVSAWLYRNWSYRPEKNDTPNNLWQNSKYHCFDYGQYQKFLKNIFCPNASTMCWH